MKITKLSLAAVAAMTLTTGAMAEVTSELSGNVKYWYETAESGGDNGLFHKDPSGSGFTDGQAAISIEAKGKAGVLGYGFKYTATDTLGLEDNLVLRGRTNASDGSIGTTAHWAEKAFITYKMGNTTAKVGRQHLNTPFVFTEAWNVAANSFDAVVINSKLSNVNLMGAFVGRSNGGNSASAGFSSVQDGGQFSDFGALRTGTTTGNGAYIFAAKAKPVKALGVNAYYTNFVNNATAYWLDADYAVGGVKLGALYASAEPSAAGSVATDAFAVKASTKAGPVSLFAAYSAVSDEGTMGIANQATAEKKTKLPTAGVYNDGLIVAQPGAKTFKIKGVMPVGNFKLIAQYVSTTNDNDTATTAAQALAASPYGKEVDEFDFIAVTKIADVNVKAIFVNRTFGTSAGETQSVVKADANHVRIIAGINF